MEYSHGEENIEFEETTEVLNNLLGDFQIQLEAINQTASHLGILALNANIEAIHAANFLDKFENTITENLLIQARMVAALMEQKQYHFNQDDMNYLLNLCGFEKIMITNEEGMIIYTNVKGMEHKRLPNSHLNFNHDDPLAKSNREIVLPKEELLDGKYRKTVVVSRKDSKGLIQVEFNYIPPRGRLTIDSFSIVAEEIRKHSKAYESIIEKIMKQKSAFNELIDKNQYSAEDFIEIHQCCKKVISMLHEIIQISKLTNLLGIRAKIEASQSTNYVGDFDHLLNIQMLVEAKICYLYFPNEEISYDETKKFTDTVGLDEIWLTNKDGIVDGTNIVGGKGFAFKNEGQTAPFMILLKDSKVTVTAPPSIRTLDGKVFKYVGIQRKNGGILQVGRKAELYGVQAETGFLHVADQVKLMSDTTKDASLNMIDILNDLAKQIMNHDRKVELL